MQSCPAAKPPRPILGFLSLLISLLSCGAFFLVLIAGLFAGAMEGEAASISTAVGIAAALLMLLAFAGTGIAAVLAIISLFLDARRWPAIVSGCI